MRKDIVVLGGGGFAREVLWLLQDCNEDTGAWNVLGFIDENPALHGQPLCELPVLGGFDWLTNRPVIHVISGVGGNAVRRKFATLVAALGIPFATLVHPDARKSRFVEIGEGTLVCAGNLLTTQVKVGRHVNLNLDCTVGHDVVIEDFCNVSPGVHLSGFVHLGEDVDVGTGAVILPGKNVGRNTTIGAGAVVTADLPMDAVAVGIPAKVVRTKA